MNREITQNETWDEESIMARGKALFPYALSTWRLPDVEETQRAIA